MRNRFNEEYKDRDISEFRVLFVIDKEERNICDQKWIEYQLF